ncbi:hypothetical protein [Actinocorallia populi]|uniref:hypothetical protein n=1 Tax=Actinocorallia populi TaxID=2079200 RepID=UPI000D086655|nr:hypothetical protein [Actinocorallia populi]
MIDFPYIGSGPYCYSNCLAMMLGADAPPVAVIETVTGSPFGMQFVGGTMPFFDPYGWNPEIGIEDALAALGWTAQTSSESQVDAALERLTSHLAHGPVMVGPIEMGHLCYQPGKTGPMGADHYVIVLEVGDEQVILHDPQGYPYTSLPLADFVKAWQADTIDYGEPYTMRTNFRRMRRVDIKEAITAFIPRAVDWLRADPDHTMPPGSSGNGDAALALAASLETDRDEELYDHLVHFAIRVGARRATDAATCLRGAGRVEAAAIMSRQARLIGSLQQPLVAGDGPTAADVLRALAPTYDTLRAELQ